MTAVGEGWTARSEEQAGAGPKVSFIIPCYNRSHYLQECLQSVSHLAYADYEVLVVDDGSTENIREIVEPFAPLARYLWQPNQGVGAARNTGLRHARGYYVKFLDSDDFLLSAEGFTRQLALLDNNPEVGLVYSQARKVDQHGQPVGIEGPLWARAGYVQTGDAELERLWIRNHIPTSSVMVRRSVFDQINPFRDYSTAEDWDCWLRIARQWSVGYVAEPVVAYRKHGNSITGHHSAELIVQVRQQVARELFADPQFARRFSHLHGPAFAHTYVRAACVAYRSRHLKTSLRYAIRGLAGGLRHRQWRDTRQAFTILGKSLVLISIGRQHKAR